LAALVIGYVLWARFSAGWTYMWSSLEIATSTIMKVPAPPPEWYENRSAIENELWVRNLILPLFQCSCYTDNQLVCDLIDDRTHDDPNVWWISKGYFLVLSFFSVGISGGIVWEFTR
jgi:hypothetical protein